MISHQDRLKVSYQDTNYRRSIPAEERLSICLRFLATGDSYRTIAGSFRAGISTVSMLIPDVVAAIWDCLVEEFMAVPGAEEWRSKSMVMGEVSRSPCRPGSPGLQDGVLKAGWLKKQRSIMKNWQLRWFVLRSEHLYFFKDEEETKPQGLIPLHGCSVNELTANADEPRHLFEIVPGGSGEKERAPVSHESFLLMATSQNDMDDWVKAIRRVIWAPFGGAVEQGRVVDAPMPEPQWKNLVKCGFRMYDNSAVLMLCNTCSVNYYDYSETPAGCECCSRLAGIFGQRLEDTVLYEKKFGSRLAPLLVEQCVDFIRERGLDEEGLFRMPGQANLVKDLQEAFDCGDKPLFDCNTDVHTVASLLKLYLRELPEPVIPFSKYEDFLTCAQLLAKDEEEGVQELGKQVSNLPLPNFNLLKYICRFLDEVQSHCNQNKMSVQNLATVFGPNILRPKMEDPVTIMEGTSLVQHLMTVLIREHRRLYEGREQESLSPPPSTDLPPPHLPHLHHRSLGAWISEEDLPSCPADPDSQSDASSLDAKLCAAVSPAQMPKPGKDAVISPSKQPRPAPSWKYSFKNSASSAAAAKPGSAADSSSSGGNWLMNGLSSLRGHRRTSSGERSGRDRDSAASSQRLSTYDNVSSSSGSVPSVDSSPWSTSSSCGTSAPESGSSDPSGGASVGVVSDWADPHRDTDVLSSEPDSCEAMELCSSAPCSENGSSAACVLMGEEGEEANGTLSGLVEGLRDELRKQRSSYEERIHKLEEASAALCSQMERLEQDMEQERKKQRMLEIKLRNSERAREDAENRNRLLEKEMEDFFSTLGDLALGARTSDI
uniref:Rho GTPase-activating protein 24 n=2 Tax=Knipowitschia caucasica TaxID=637954 RepID=A0AAV2LSB7_KNICA